MHSMPVNNATTSKSITQESFDRWLLFGLISGGIAVFGFLLVCIRYCLGRIIRKRKARRRRPSTVGVPVSTSHESPRTSDRTADASVVISGRESVSYRVDKKPRRTVPRKEIAHASPIASDRCPQNTCQQYSRDLRIDSAFFNFQFNKCYCSQCYPTTKTNSFMVAGSIYTAPRGWVRFGLHIDQVLADSKEIFKQWYTTFYGTSSDKLGVILRERFIPFPGDSLLSGGTFATHLSDKNCIYTSPSISYASLSHVCPIQTAQLNGKQYNVQVVLECKQNPVGITKQGGCRSGVCSIIPDGEIEWKTNRRGSVVPYGLLIRAQKR